MREMQETFLHCRIFICISPLATQHARASPVLGPRRREDIDQIGAQGGVGQPYPNYLVFRLQREGGFFQPCDDVPAARYCT